MKQTHRARQRQLIGCAVFAATSFLVSFGVVFVIVILMGSQPVMAASPQSTDASYDMLSPLNAQEACVTASGDIANIPIIAMMACRGTANQMWERGADNKWRVQSDPAYCLARQTPSSWDLTTLPCGDARTIELVPHDTVTRAYMVSGTSLALDFYSSDQVLGLYSFHGGSNQQFRWLQEDVDAVIAQGCAITYPMAYSDTAGYARELACDRVSRLQPPYVVPTQVVRAPALFPGVVPSDVIAVSQGVSFDLNFKSHSYLRMSTPPQNWRSTGLYAPAGAIISVTVLDGTITDVQHVAVRLGVHTDRLTPSSSNVVNGTFDRYPSVSMRVKLEPGLNWVRTPYGGPIILESTQALSKALSVQIDGAVQAPYFVLGQTSEAEWLARRGSPTPYAEIEGDTQVMHVPSSEVSGLSYSDVMSVALYYDRVTALHNQLSGLSASEVMTHQPPMGKQRHVEDVQISAGWGHSGFPIMYYNAWHNAVPDESVYRSTGWGVYHELGHNYQMGAWSYVFGTETTVNLWSLYAQENLFGNSRLVDSNSYATAIALVNNPVITDVWNAAGPFEQLVFLDQIRLGFPQLNWSMWTQLMRRYREMPSAEYNAATASDQAKRDTFLKVLCDITEVNLTPHFEAWDIPISQTAKDYCAGKAALTQQLWLIDGAKSAHVAMGSGQVQREWWTNIAGASVISLTSDLRYPNNPSGSDVITGGFAVPVNWGSNYGQRVRGYLTPPVSGVYRFWLSADDAAALSLSTDADPLHVAPLMSIISATGDFDSQRASVQRSAPVLLQAGQAYYIELLHQERNGGDHAKVGWEIPAGAGVITETRRVIEAKFLSPYASDLALQVSRAVGQPMTVTRGSDVSLTVRVVNQSSGTAKDVVIANRVPDGFALSPINGATWQTGYRYVRLVGLSEAGNRGPWASMAELYVLDGAGQAIDRSGWRIASVDSEEPSDPATDAIDGDVNTIWHTRWSSSPTTYPHTITVDMNGLALPTGFVYVPRQSGSNGRIGQYRFEVSQDGSTWATVASGNFADSSVTKTVTFTAPMPSIYFATLSGPIAPGASGAMNIVLRASETMTYGRYSDAAEIVSALDATATRIHDSDAAYDAAFDNDTVIDDVLDNSGGDEDDNDIALFGVGEVASAPDDLKVYLPVLSR